jgi:hypothetical protein
MKKICILKVTRERSRIPGSGSAPKCHGSPTLEKRVEGFFWRRRYILVQLLIMFQYLQTSVKFKTDKQVSQVVIGMGG